MQLLNCANQHWSPIFCLLLLAEGLFEEFINRKYKLLFSLMNQLHYLHELYVFHHEIVLETSYFVFCNR
jgi:hypothetical protein